MLGRIGAPEHVAALRELAATDPHTAISELDGYDVLGYPVRDACRAAAGQISVARSIRPTR